MMGHGTAAGAVDGAGVRLIAAVVSAVEAAILAEEGPVATGKGMTLNEQEKARISETVHAAERRTSAEIVPMLVTRSGLYRDAQHRTGLGLALLVLTGLLMWEVWLPWGWHAANAAWLILGTLLAYSFGSWLGTYGPVIRAVTSPDTT